MTSSSGNRREVLCLVNLRKTDQAGTLSQLSLQITKPLHPIREKNIRIIIYLGIVRLYNVIHENMGQKHYNIVLLFVIQMIQIH